MAEAFLHLSPKDQREVLEVAGAASGRPLHLLEKNVWVVWTLATLFGSRFGEYLVFKGGTSLSKAYQAIRRFSEDVDLTYDIRAIAPDLMPADGDALPANRSQEKKWTREIRARLSTWVADEAAPFLAERLSADGLAAQLNVDDEKLFISYEPLAHGSGYVRPAVVLEFGARSTGEPWDVRPVTCDAAGHVPTVIFPSAQPHVMRAERTFWEKATAIHVFCVQGRFRSAERFARHWHDIVRLDEAGYVDPALADRTVASAVARHKAIFFAEKDGSGNSIDYATAIAGKLQLVPENEAREVLAEDYRRMVEDGLLFDEAEPFAALLEKCQQIEDRANGMARTK